MAGLVPATHAVLAHKSFDDCGQRRGVDGRDKPGHDGSKGTQRSASGGVSP
jgi:hypothetical protein